MTGDETCGGGIRKGVRNSGTDKSLFRLKNRLQGYAFNTTLPDSDGLDLVAVLDHTLETGTYQSILSGSEPLPRANDYDGHVLEIHSRPAIWGV